MEIVRGNKNVTARKRLTLTLQLLAIGKTFKSSTFQFRICDCATSYIVEGSCLAIVKVTLIKSENYN